MAKAVRFAVIDHRTSAHSGAWKIWVQRNDVYFTASDLGGRIKVSLHPGCWRVAFTEEHWRSGEVPRNAPGPGRNIWEIDPVPDIVDGVQHAWSLLFPLETLIYLDPLPPRVERIVAPERREVVNVNLWLCDPDVTRRPQYPIDPSPLCLADGRRLWVGVDLGRAAPDPSFDPTETVSTMVGFRTPSFPGDTPGFEMRTVRLDFGEKTR